MARKSDKDKFVAVIGLGRFGGSLARRLVATGWEVLGIDSDERLIQHMSSELTHAVTADSTDPDALGQLGIVDFNRVVVGIGTDVQASILTTSLLVDMEIPNIWAKAISRQHGTILRRIGAHHVVHPEHDMGERLAHLVTGRMLDYIRFEDDFALVKTMAPAEAIDQTLGEARLRTKHGVTVVCVKRRGESFTYATPETFIRDGDVLIVAGKTNAVERFAELT